MVHVRSRGGGCGIADAKQHRVPGRIPDGQYPPSSSSSSSSSSRGGPAEVTTRSRRANSTQALQMRGQIASHAAATQRRRQNTLYLVQYYAYVDADGEAQSMEVTPKPPSVPVGSPVGSVANFASGRHKCGFPTRISPGSYAAVRHGRWAVEAKTL